MVRPRVSLCQIAAVLARIRWATRVVAVVALVRDPGQVGVREVGQGRVVGHDVGQDGAFVGLGGSSAGR